METKRALLLGDEIRLAYQPKVEEILAQDRQSDIQIVGPVASSGTSTDILENIENLLDHFQPDVVHFNAGLEDVRWYRDDNRNHVPFSDYELNLQKTVQLLKPRMGSDIIFALTTPVIDSLQCEAEGCDWDRMNSEIEEYNIKASEVMLSLDVLIDHLDKTISEQLEDYLGRDGVSLTDTGIEAAGKAVASCISSLWH